MLVLDSSYFFSADSLPEGDHVCPPGVVHELESHGDPRLSLWGDMVRVSDCTEASMERVREAARASGDLGRLSPVDMSVLALALDVDGTIMTDDYSIQNVARILGVPYRPVGTDGIRRVAKWNYQCVGCRKWYKERLSECPVCGSPMRACRKRRSGEQAAAPDQVAEAPLSQQAHAQLSAPLGPECEGVRQALVERRRPQRPLHYPAPLLLVSGQWRPG